LVYTGHNQMRADGTLCALIAMAFQIPPNVAGDMLIGLPKRTRPYPQLLWIMSMRKPIELMRQRIN
jgi:hypothetical protein